MAPKREPVVSRPYMPGYPILPPNEGGGLLPWSWAEYRLRTSRYYWIGSVRPDGRPHSAPVWGAWNQDAFWFSSSVGSRKARNLRANPHVAVTTEDPVNPVILEGEAELITNRALIAIFLNRTNTKYGQSYGLDFLDPDVNALFRVFPKKVIGLEEDNFFGTPTRWEFDRR